MCYSVTIMTQRKLNNALSNVGGRFFGIEKNDGTRVNAKLVNETAKYVTVTDTRSKEQKKMAKSSINSLTVGGQTIK